MDSHFPRSKGVAVAAPVQLTGPFPPEIPGSPTGTPGPLLTSIYPNPTNAGAVIRCRLAGEAPAALAIFDLAGQRVATLLAGPRISGPQVVLGRPGARRPSAGLGGLPGALEAGGTPRDREDPADAVGKSTWVCPSNAHMSTIDLQSEEYFSWRMG